MDDELLVLISSDGHIGALKADFYEHLETRYHAQLDEWWDGLQVKYREIHAATGGESPIAYRSQDERFTSAQISDPALRTKLLEHEGAVAEVLLPGPDFTHLVPFTALYDGVEPWAGRLSPEIEWVGQQCYNRWLAAYCSYSPDQCAGLAFLPLHDPDECVVEIAHVADTPGMRGVVIPAFDLARLPVWSDAAFEPVWAACAEAGLPVVAHANISGIKRADDSVIENHPFASTLRSNPQMWWREPLNSMILGGVLDRHPTLNVVMTEVGVQWVQLWLTQLERLHDSDENPYPRLPNRPSDYWRRQCFLGASIASRDEFRSRWQIGGPERLMYGIDVPHAEGSWGNNTGYLYALLDGSGASLEEIRNFVGLTAARVYGFDLARLQPVAARVDLRLADVLSPPERQLHPIPAAFAFAQAGRSDMQMA